MSTGGWVLVEQQMQHYNIWLLPEHCCSRTIVGCTTQALLNHPLAWLLFGEHWRWEREIVPDHSPVVVLAVGGTKECLYQQFFKLFRKAADGGGVYCVDSDAALETRLIMKCLERSSGEPTYFQAIPGHRHEDMKIMLPTEETPIKIYQQDFMQKEVPNLFL